MRETHHHFCISARTCWSWRRSRSRRQLTAIFGTPALPHSPLIPLTALPVCLIYRKFLLPNARAYASDRLLTHTHTDTQTHRHIETQAGRMASDRGRQAVHTLKVQQPDDSTLASSVSFRAQSSHYLRQRASDRDFKPASNIAYTPRATCSLSLSLPLSVSLSVRLSVSSFVCKSGKM